MRSGWGRSPRWAESPVGVELVVLGYSRKGPWPFLRFQVMLRTVKVPAAMEPAFEKAEEVVSEFFRRRLDSPERGTIEIFGQRYVLVRAASLSIEFFDLVEDLFGKDREQESVDFARNILLDLAHAIGKSDATAFFRKIRSIIQRPNIFPLLDIWIWLKKI